jgi:hypothetical protein
VECGELGHCRFNGRDCIRRIRRNPSVVPETAGRSRLNFMAIINLKLAKHPLNWLTIILMLLIAAVAGHLTLSYLGIEPKTAAQ